MMTMLVSVLRITAKKKTLLWMHLLDIKIRTSGLSLHVERLSILCLICLWRFLRYLIYRFLRQPTLAQRFWYLLCITWRGSP
jgi:hypothetical protein